MLLRRGSLSTHWPVRTRTPLCSPCRRSWWKRPQYHLARWQTSQGAGCHSYGSQLGTKIRSRNIEGLHTHILVFIHTHTHICMWNKYTYMWYHLRDKIYNRGRVNEPTSSRVSNFELRATWSFPQLTIWTRQSRKINITWFRCLNTDDDNESETHSPEDRGRSSPASWWRTPW